MKIRVTLIILLCTSIAAESRTTIGDQQISSDISLSNKKNLMKRSLSRQRSFEYSKNMENIDLRNENGAGQSQINKPVYHAGAIIKQEHLSHGLSGSIGVQSGRTLHQQLPTVRMNHEQTSKIFEVGFVPKEEKKGLSRHKKDQMEQALLALLMAYKMKFTALIPILLGGLSLLVSTTALAGFFFALFAAVLGLKAH